MKKNFLENGRRIGAHLLGGMLLMAALFCMSGTVSARLAPDYDDPEYVEKTENGTLGDIPSSGTVVRGEADPFTGKVYHHDERFADSNIIHGVDVSKWNHKSETDSIDWEKVKAAGVEFVMIRIGYSTLAKGVNTADHRFEEHYKGAKAAGLKIGVYYYSQSITVAEAQKEAAFVLKLLNGRDLDFPVCFDGEAPETGRLYQAGLSANVYHRIAKSFCTGIKAAGYDTMVYFGFSGRNILYGNNEKPIESYADVWFARYVGETSNYAALYSGDYTIWQYTDSGSVDGIPTVTDCNFYYSPKSSSFLRVKVTENGTTGLDLSWSGADAAKYAVYRASSYGGTYKKVAEVTGKTYSDTGLKNGREYYYKVQAVAADGTLNAESAAATGRIEMTAPYQIRMNTAVTAREHAGDEYVAARELASGTIGTVTSYTRDENGNLWYHLDATVNRANVTAYVPASSSAIYVGKVANVKRKSATYEDLTMKWDAQTGATGYQIYVSKAYNGRFKKLATVKGSTSYTHRKLAKSCIYYYKIRAYRKVSGKVYYGSFSSVASLGTKAVKLPVVTRKNLILRKRAGVTFKKIITFPKGMQMNARYRTRDAQGNWWYYVTVTLNRKTYKGYVLRNYVKRM